MRHRLFVLCLMVLSACSAAHPELDATLEEALAALDSVLDSADIYANEKEAHIDSLRQLIPFARNDRQLYDIYDSLFDEYEMWDSDSALFYAHRKELLAENLGTPLLINDATADIASRYITSGMYLDALELISNTDRRTSSFFRQDPSRYLLLYDIYHNLVISFNDKYAHSKNRELERAYLEKGVQNLNKNDINYFIYLSKSMIADGSSGQLVIILRNKLTDGRLTTHDKAILHYWMGTAYESMGDTPNAFLCYIISAREDIACANREYGSLIHVAQLCHEYGLTERSFRYINRCHKDALIADAKRRLNQIGKSLFDIGLAYEQLSKKQKSVIVFLNFSLVLIALMLVNAIVWLKVYNNKLTHAYNVISDNMSAIDEATRANKVYLARFFSMFSNHIDALERYRSRLRKLAKQMDMDAMQQELRSDIFIDEELSNMYDVFDKTFLGLFPTFIEEVNELLRPEARIQKNLQDGKLTNEIRVLALIKLGMTESRQIANFLRLSTTTVFNYRVKYRNAALHDRDTFEESLRANTRTRLSLR